MRGTKAKALRAEAAKLTQQGYCVRRTRNNTAQRVTSDQRYLYQLLKGRR